MSISPPRRKFDWHGTTQYDSQENIMNRKRIWTLIKSKTVIGAVLGAAAYLVGLDHIDANAIITAGSPVLAAIGIRDALPGR